MITLIGSVALVFALLGSAAGLLAAMAAARLESKLALRIARASIFAVLGGFTAASIVLLVALVQSDFGLFYVVRFTEKALPLGYKYAAFWAGQEGSLLLWGWLVAAFGGIWILTTLKKQDAQSAIATGTIAVVCGLFASIMLFCDSNEAGKNANPFHQMTAITIDGREEARIMPDGKGLNPMLQDPAMVAHPPLLFMGYAGFTIPFAVMVGALIVGRKDNEWIASIRRWLVASWLLLTVGILLGAQWAYVELGWGGYWAWDPVENASLLPWLTATALLHSVMVQQQRGMLKRWNAALIALTFLLCVFGTWITRSGVVQSVHSFGKSPIGTFFAVFLVLGFFFSVMLIAMRNEELASEHELETAWGREGMFMIVNILLVIMTVVTTVGTLFPAVSEAITGHQIAVKAPFYNNVVVPMGLLLMAMMAMGPLLSLGKDAGEQLGRRLIAPGIGGFVAAVFTAIFLIPGGGTGGMAAVLRAIWALACAFVVGMAAISLLSELFNAIVARVRGLSENPVLATLRVIDGNHRRYGGQTVHVGMLMLMVGLAGSSLYNVEYDVEPAPGETVEVAGWRVRLDSLADYRGKNYRATEAKVQVTDPGGVTRTLTPEMRWYDKFQKRAGNEMDQINSEVAIWTNLQRDAYLTLQGYGPLANDDQQIIKPLVAAIKVRINPLVLWLWVGGIVMIVGSVWCLLPRLLPAGQAVETSVAEVASRPPPLRRGGSEASANWGVPRLED